MNNIGPPLSEVVPRSALAASGLLGWEEGTITEHTLERLRLVVTQAISDEVGAAMEVSASLRDGVAGELVVRLVTHILSAEVRVEKRWSDLADEPRWARWLRWLTPPFLRPVTVRHHHNCPHVPQRTDWVTEDCR